MARHALLLALALAHAASSFAQVASAGAATAGAALPAGADDKHPCTYEPPQQLCHTDPRTGTTGCEDKGAWCERPNDVQNARKVMLVFGGVIVGYAVLVAVNSRRRLPASSEELPLLTPKAGQSPSAPADAGETYGKAMLFCCCPCLWRTRQDQYTSAAFLAFLFAWLLTGFFFIKPCPNNAPFFSFCSGAGSDAYTCVLTPDSTACVAQL